MYTPSQLAEVLRETIKRVEQGTDVSPHDPALLELKRIILLRIAALELEESRLSRIRAPEVPSSPTPDQVDDHLQSIDTPVPRPL
jgi:hypothetical protein